MSNKIISGEKNYKYFVGYLYDDHKTKPLNIMLPKKARYDDQAKWMYFLIEDNDLLSKLNLLGIKTAQILKKNLIANLSIIKTF